jgi:hypothetical protein
MSAALTILTVGHVLVSLVGLGTGFVVLWGMLNNRLLNRWTAAFLVASIAASASGFLFPVDHVTPAHILAVLSLGVLGVAVFARYHRSLAGRWRTTYSISTVTAQYLNFFVLIVQLFLKVPALTALAPTQTEPAFAIVQLVTLLVFVAVGIAAALRFRNRTSASALTNRSSRISAHHV